MTVARPQGLAVRRDAGLYGYERALSRRGFWPVAGVDEAGRGACAGPLVVAAVVLPTHRRDCVSGLADSKQLTPSARAEAYDRIVTAALAWSVVTVPAVEVDQQGVHAVNLAAMRRACERLEISPAYVLIDGFPVRGMNVPSLAVPRGDRVAACVAAASIVAKVSRDRIMLDLDARFHNYGFATHKGYVTPSHRSALDLHGPCAEHRFSYANVMRSLRHDRVAHGAVDDGARSGPSTDVVGRQRPTGSTDLRGAASMEVRHVAEETRKGTRR